ncbi:c-type cytochrome [Rhizobium mongolense]|uniref:c-type cytochrome n=1 Tax=Rhizobium mongolense TaxID=57676 RepID=UPI00161ECCBC|nr:c-type cytochrome [Rhizobium mongolense]
MSRFNACVLSVARGCRPGPGAGAGQSGGERLFRTRCGTCHSANSGENRMGPHLSGLLGRSAGTIEGARYSKALGGSGIVWDEERLQAFLANPRQVVPGTTMTVSIRDEAQRSAIIAYLRSLSTAN